MNFTQCLQKRVFCLVTNARRGITIAWIVSLVLVLIAFIVACVAANRLQGAAGVEIAASFAAMWTALLLIALSIIGTVIMRRYKAALPIGAFLGVIFVMTQQMLILFTIYADRAGKAQTGVASQVTQAEQAMAVFSFFLFLVYGFFGLLLAVFRNDIIVEENVGKGQYSDNLKDVEQPSEYN